jgi:PAS domain S-box-containing protein
MSRQPLFLTESAPAPARAGTDFLAGGGEVGARLRALDWTRSPLGPPERWPQSLKTIVRVMLDSRYAMWMLWGPELTFFCNDAYLPTVGLKRDWVLGARADLVWEEIWPDIGPRIQQVLTQGEATWDEALLLFLERSGFVEETYHTFSYSPVYDDESRIAGMLCVVTEVTERVIGERQLQTLRDLAARSSGAVTVQQAAETLVAGLADDHQDVPFALLYILDPAAEELRLAAMSGAVPQALRPERIALADETVPWPVAPALHGTTQDVSLSDVGAFVAAAPWPEPIRRALVLPVSRRGAATVAAVLVAGLSPRREPDDSYRGFLELVARQFGAALADARSYESERARAAALAEIDRAKTQFFSNVSHEFRTPLTLMLGPMQELLADAALSGQARERLEIVHRNALRLQKMVNSLLDFTRIEAGRADALYEPTDLAAFTAELASSFRAACERAGLRLDVECPVLGEPVFVDRDMWEKIVLNLLSNAYKFTLEGSISVSVTRQEHEAVLTVTDTGTGIRAADLPHVFERFHRIEGARARTHEGTGIGLALVQELVNLHGGRVSLQSAFGEGSTFTVHIPLGHGHLPAERLGAGAAHAARGGRHTAAYLEEALGWRSDISVTGAESAAAMAAISSSAAEPDPRPLVLLADDNADMRNYVRRLLEASYRVVAVGDGREALAAAQARHPDLVLTDVMMPNLDGFGLLRALRAEKRMAAIPVIFLSARAGEEATVIGLEAGVDDYLVKPFTARELLARVASVLALARFRRQAAEELRLSEERFRAVQEASPDAFAVLEAQRDAAGAIVDFRWAYVNEAAARLVGRPRESLPGTSVASVLPAHRELGLAAQYARVIETGTPWVSELRYTRDGVDSVMRLAVARVGDGVAISTVDLSARWRAEEALREAARQKDEFLAMLAHELRNPLAPIRNASEVLARLPAGDARALAVVDIIRRQVTHLTRLVDDLLDVSRITQQRIELKKETVDVADVIRHAVETVEPLLRERHHELQLLSSYRALLVSGDFARLVQCLVNLLTNAAKYTDDGGRILVASREEDGTAVIEITDDGVGIPAALLPKIFDLFVQSERTLDRAQGGLGIGLSVVRRLVEMHGGEVSARSGGPGEGSTFAVRLPLVVPARVASEEEPAQVVAARRILVVDDNRDAADSLAMMLKFDGHEAEAVYGGAEALERTAALAPQVVLLDIGLPGMDGYEVARRMRELALRAGLKVIALTGYGQPEDRARALQAGFDDHLVKPVDLVALKRCLASLEDARGDGASG